MRIPRRAYLSTSQRGWPTRSFRRNQNQEKERVRENGKRTYRGDRDRTCSVCKGTKQGNPGRPEKLHYKRRGRAVKKVARKKGKKHKKKRRNSLERTIRKIHPERKILREEQNTVSRYPVKATIAHTRIQRESNFASFEGWNSHSRLQFLSLIGPCITSLWAFCNQTDSLLVKYCFIIPGIPLHLFLYRFC